ncbi:MAG TPA: septum formation initiator [Clostridiales bacterium]|nr:septum formation initiator [Clostridiales bacterium]
MSLTPLDIHNKEFARSFRGYREEEVDDFLDLVVREFETVLRDSTALRDRIQECEKELRHYRNLEDTLNRTLIVAQETAREIKANADKEALLAIRQAEQQATRVIDEAQTRMGRAFAEYDELRRRAQVFRVRMRNFLESQLDLFQDATQDVDDDEGHQRLRSAPLPESTVQPVAVPEEPFEPLTPSGGAQGPGELPGPARGRRHWVDDLLDDKEDSR